MPGFRDLIGTELIKQSSKLRGSNLISLRPHTRINRIWQVNVLGRWGHTMCILGSGGGGMSHNSNHNGTESVLPVLAVDDETSCLDG